MTLLLSQVWMVMCNFGMLLLQEGDVAADFSLMGMIRKMGWLAILVNIILLLMSSGI
jgi:hypothetical protein